MPKLHVDYKILKSLQKYIVIKYSEFTGDILQYIRKKLFKNP